MPTSFIPPDSKAASTGMLIDGIFGSEYIDSSGEVLDVAGCDIVEMEEGRAIANWEHRGDDAPAASGLDVVGKVVYAKKIFKESDCENDRQKLFWNKLKVPYIYGVVRLYDGAGHDGARALAAQIRDHVANGEPILVRYSIEGSTLEQKGNRLARTVGRRVALTIKPCNRTCDSGLIADPNAPEGFEKIPSGDKEEKLTLKHENPLYTKLGASFETESLLPQDTLVKSLLKEKIKKTLRKKEAELLERSAPDRLATPEALTKKVKEPQGDWESPDGLSIPKTPSKERGQWDKAFMKLVQQHFGAGRRLIVPVAQTTPRNPAVNGNRLDLYQRMAAGGDKLPPIVVRKMTDGSWYVMDGNHRVEAAKREGVTHLEAFDIGKPDNEPPEKPKKRSPKMKKAITAGIATGAPSSLEGGAALQREEISNKVSVTTMKAALEGYDEEKHGDLKAYLKSQLPEASDEFIEHFTSKLGDFKVKLKKADGDMEPDILPENKLPTAPKAEAPVHKQLTVRGKPLKPNPQMKPGDYVFDEHTGSLKTHLGTLKMYNPDQDKDNKWAGQAFRDIWHSDSVRKQHDYAVSNWLRVNKAMKEGRLPEAVVATSVAFSQLSPNTPVPVHEMMYAYLLDTMKAKGYDLRDPRFADFSTYEDWKKRDRPHGTPESSFDYFFFDIDHLITNQADSALTDRKEGERMPFALAGNKFKNMAQYHTLHRQMVDLVKKHGVDTRSAVAEMMANKDANKAWEARRARAIAAGKPDIGESPVASIPGLAPKTARFAYSMMGGGNSFVPDTHFSRHLFGLDKDLDQSSINMVRNRIMWNEKRTGLLDAFDRWYFRNHPAVTMMMEHPEFGDYFKSNPEQAIFPAFWGHWLSISQHEAALGHKMANVATNQSASHRPIFEEIERLMQHPTESQNTVPARTSELDESPSAKILRWGRKFKKSEEEARASGGPLIHPVMAAALVHKWAEEHGHEYAMFRYYSHVVPLLMHGAEEEPLSHLVRKAEKLSVELKKAEEALRDGLLLVKMERAQVNYASEDEPVDAEKHGLPQLNKRPEQTEMIHGLDLNQQRQKKSEWMVRGGGDWLHAPNGHMCYVKNNTDLDALREVAYHNIAHDFFGLGHYCANTAIFRHPSNGDLCSAQQIVPGAQHLLKTPTIEAHDEGHYAGYRMPEHQVATLHQLGDSGELHKLAIMNSVLGNTDRHDYNYVFTDDPAGPPLRLIDHGHTFMSWPLNKTPDRISAVMKPEYLQWYERLKSKNKSSRDDTLIDPQKMHPEAAAWALGLDANKLYEHVLANGHSEKAAQLSRDSLLLAQKNLRENPACTYMQLWQDPMLWPSDWDASKQERARMIA